MEFQGTVKCYVTFGVAKIGVSRIAAPPGLPAPARRYPPALFSGPWRVPFMNSRLTMLRNGTLTLDYVPLRDIKCKVNPEHVNDLLGFDCYQGYSINKGINDMTNQIDYRNGLDLAKLAYRFFLTMGKTELPSLTPNYGSLVILDRENPEVIVRLTRADGATRDYAVKKSWASF